MTRPTDREHADTVQASASAASAETMRDSTDAIASGADYSTLTTVDPAHYVDRAELNRGGMGRIVVARDRRLHRKVAIKELRADSPGLRARFEREAWLTGRLQHPSIVSIHEAGRWPSGEPFFAMELVGGRAMDVVVATAHTFEQRLALLPNVLAVADALAYAHSMRIVHRDLKPQNVIVGEFGETVVIDWGLGKCLDDSVAEPEASGAAPPGDDLAATVEGDVIGTPAYMPPEQARGEPVDERADVYAIGALLFHVLSGRPPYVGNSSAAVLDAVLHGPHVSLEELERRIPPDLLAVVTRAMANDRARRYPSARELAEDLRRFQSGQLVGAHRYTPGQLLRRWIVRHRIAVTVASVALVALVAVGAVSVRRVVAEEQRAQSARRLAEERGALAARRGAAAEELLTFMLGELGDRLAPIGKLDLLDTVAAKAAEFFRTEGDATALDPAIRVRARRSVGDVLQTKGDAPGALAEYRAGLVLGQSLVARAPADRSARVEVYEMQYRIAEVLMEQADVEGASAAVREAMAGIDALAREAPSDDLQRARSVGHLKLADLALRRGELDAAASELATALAMFESLMATGKASERDLMVVHNRLADVRRTRGDVVGALAELRKGLELAAQYAAKQTGDLQRARDLGIAQRAVGDALTRTGDHREALEKFRASQLTAEQLVAHDPQNASWQEDLVQAHMRIGEIMSDTGKLADAERAFGAALASGERLLALDPMNPRWQRMLAKLHHHVADLRTQRDDPRGALVELRGALALLESLAARDATADAAQIDLAVGHLKLGNALVSGGDAAAALTSFRTALAILEPRHAREPANADLLRTLSAIRGGIGGSLATQGHMDEGLVELRASLAIDERLAALDPTDQQAASDLAWSHVNLADLLAARGDAVGARGEQTAALAIAAHVLETSPNDARMKALAARLRAETR